MGQPSFLRPVLILIAGCVGLGCSHANGAADAPVPPNAEIVMAPGSRIAARTGVGDIVVTAGRGLKRCYQWEGAERCVEMWPRKERWLGSLGIYFPGPGYHWAEHKGIARGVVQEGQQHFQTLEDAMAWIDQRKRWLPVKYRNDGLLVGWAKGHERKQLNVEVWQLHIAGAKPTQLPGAEDHAISVSQP